jgi:signal peptidase I
MQAENSIPTNPGQANGFKSKYKGKFKNIKDSLTTFAFILTAPLLALLLTTFVFQSYEVDGPSMETTLQDKDRLIVWKMPRTLSRIGASEFIPQRGEVIVFVKKGQYGDDGKEKSLIKRVIGLPGDRVSISDGKITVYNKENPEGFNPDERQNYTKNLVSEIEGAVDVAVRQGEIFVMGDNRPNSLDSRAFGTIRAEDIVGVLAYRILPLNNIQSF